MQSALKEVLGNDIAQAGSQVEPNRTRFDFTFDRALTKDELTRVERIMNSWISENLIRETSEMTMDEARSSGAIALFDEKYGDKVRVISVGDISKELCGGTHVESTGEIRICKIISESAIASGVRRIEAICADTAIEYLNNKEQELESIAKSIKAPIADTVLRVEKLIEESKNQQKRIRQLEAEIAKSKVSQIANNAKEIEGGKLLIEKLEGLTPDVLKSAVDNVSDKLGNCIVVLASVFDGKVSIIAKVSDNFVKNGINAGKLVNEIATKCAGRGGGRPNFAQAGAKDPSKLSEALDQLSEVLS